MAKLGYHPQEGSATLGFTHQRNITVPHVGKYIKFSTAQASKIRGLGTESSLLASFAMIKPLLLGWCEAGVGAHTETSFRPPKISSATLVLDDWRCGDNPIGHIR